MKHIVWIGWFAEVKPGQFDRVWLDAREIMLGLGFAIGEWQESLEGAEELARVFRETAPLSNVPYDVKLLPDGSWPWTDQEACQEGLGRQAGALSGQRTRGALPRRRGVTRRGRG